MLMFNSKIKILIKKINWTTHEKKIFVTHFFFKTNGKTYKKQGGLRKQYKDEPKKRAIKGGETKQIQVNLLNPGQSFKTINY